MDGRKEDEQMHALRSAAISSSRRPGATKDAALPKSPKLKRISELICVPNPIHPTTPTPRCRDNFALG